MEILIGKKETNHCIVRKWDKDRCVKNTVGGGRKNQG
jgi:hypothetical protein